jgi:hypothetical protein
LNERGLLQRRVVLRAKQEVATYHARLIWRRTWLFVNLRQPVLSCKNLILDKRTRGSGSTSVHCECGRCTTVAFVLLERGASGDIRLDCFLICWYGLGHSKGREWAQSLSLGVSSGEAATAVPAMPRPHSVRESRSDVEPALPYKTNSCLTLYRAGSHDPDARSSPCHPSPPMHPKPSLQECPLEVLADAEWWTHR